MPGPVYSAERQVWRDGSASVGARLIPEETALALTYNGGTYAVMMGTPQDLRDFAIGFSLSEGIVQSPDDIMELDIVELDDGTELRMWLASSRAELLSQRRRHIAGPTGCGICGIDSIAEAVRPAAIVPKGRAFSPREITAAMASVAPLQTINIETRAVHAAAFWTPARGIVSLREDVGRHNALDKLIGALARGGEPAAHGIVLLTSRVSIELIQKSARLGAPVVAAVSVPTAAGICLAEACGITLVAIARGQDFEVFTHHQRIIDRAQHHVA
jgi:FdhD protein